MGAYAVDYVDKAVNNSSFVGSNASGAVNNSNYAGSTVSKTVTASSVSSVASKAGATAGTVLSVGGKVLSRANLYLTAAQLAYSVGSSIWDYFTKEEIEQMTDEERETVQQYESMQKVAETQQQKTEAVKEETKAVADSVTYEQGQTLPSVLSQNAKALTQSINALTVSFNEQFGLLNNYMMANVLYQQQFLDLKTAESGLKIESMEFMKKTQPVYDLDGNKLGEASPRDVKFQKDTVVGIDNTDKINFNLDDDGNLDDIVDGVDFSSILGYSGDTEVVKELFKQLGGQGL